MASTPVAVTTLQAFLKIGKDLRKHSKALLRHLQDVHDGSSDLSWSRDIPDSFLDSLLVVVLPSLEGTSTTERECIKLIHLICSKALLPSSWRKAPLVPMFRRGPPGAGIGAAKGDGGTADKWVQALIEAEINKHPEDVSRRAMAIKTLGAISETGRVSSQMKKEIGSAIRTMILNDSMLVRISAPPPEEPEGPSGPAAIIVRSFRRSSSSAGNLNASDKETERNFIMLSEACLICARKALPESGPVLYEDVAVALGAVRGEICRLAMAFFLKASDFDVERVSREFSFRLPAAPGTIDLSDPTAARDFAKLMLMLTAGPSDKPFHALSLLVRDDRHFVSLLVCSLLAHLPWQWLLAHVLPARVDEQKSERERRQSAARARLVPEIVYTLSEALKSSKSTVLLAACEGIALLGKARNNWISEDPQARHSSDDPFFALSGKVTSLFLDSRNDAIRLKAAAALAWIGKPSVFPQKLVGMAGSVETGSEVIVDAALERCRRNPSAELCDALLVLLWNYRSQLEPMKTVQQVMAVSLPHSRIAAFRCFLSLLDWANDTQDTKWELALLGVIGAMNHLHLPSPAGASRLVPRIERVLRFSPSWLNRKEAAATLTKLAIVAGEPVRIQVYEALQDYSRFMASRNCLHKDVEIREGVIAPALALFDDVYSLFAQRQLDPRAYESLNKRVQAFCTGLPSDFSFLVQAKEQLGDETLEEDEDEKENTEEEEDEEDEVDDVTDEDDDEEEEQEDPQIIRGNLSQQRRQQNRDRDYRDEDDDDRGIGSPDRNGDEDDSDVSDDDDED